MSTLLRPIGLPNKHHFTPRVSSDVEFHEDICCASIELCGQLTQAAGAGGAADRGMADLGSVAGVLLEISRGMFDGLE